MKGWKKHLKAVRQAFHEHWHRKYRKPHAHLATWVLGFDLFLATILGALVVFWIFSSQILPRAVGPTALLDIKGLESAKSGEEIVLTVPYENCSTTEFGNVEMRVLLPFDFEMTSTEPVATSVDERSLRFSLDGVPACTRGTVVVRGLLYGDAGQTKTFLAQLTFWEAGHDRASVIIDRHEVTVEEGELSSNPSTGFAVSAIVSEPADPLSLVAGESVKVTMRYQHRGSRPLSDVRLRLKVPLSLVEDVEPKTLAWTMAEVTPGESGEFVATFKVRSAIDAEDLVAAGGARLEIAAQADYFYGTDRVRVLRAVSKTQTVPIRTALGVEAAAYYYSPDGDQLGRGPLPPKVDETTKYWVVLHVTNTVSPVPGALLEARLPDGVEWTGKTSVSAGSTLDYLPSVRGVRWQIGEVPAFADGIEPRISASFEVAVTPTFDDIGKILPLLSDISLTGRDDAADATVRGTAEDVTSELKFDVRAEGKTKVAE